MSPDTNPSRANSMILQVKTAGQKHNLITSMSAAWELGLTWDGSGGVWAGGGAGRLCPHQASAEPPLSLRAHVASGIKFTMKRDPELIRDALARFWFGLSIT